jgi:hypothetical protein
MNTITKPTQVQRKMRNQEQTMKNKQKFKLGKFKKLCKVLFSRKSKGKPIFWTKKAIF